MIKRIIMFIIPDRRSGRAENRFAFLEEIFRFKMICYEKIIIEIDEVLAKPINAMKAAFYHGTVECRQEFRRDEVPMENDLQFGVVQVKPFGYLSVCDQENIPDPRSIFLYRAKPKLKDSPISESRGLYGLLFGLGKRAIQILFLLPGRIAAVHPSYHKVNGLGHFLPSFEEPAEERNSHAIDQIEITENETGYKGHYALFFDDYDIKPCIRGILKVISRRFLFKTRS